MTLMEVLETPRPELAVFRLFSSVIAVSLLLGCGFFFAVFSGL
jgi:hypothetical protein